MTSWTRELDEATVLATKSGYWHTVLFYLLCSLAAIPTSFLVFSQVFTTATPEHWCAAPPELQVLDLPPEELRALLVPGGAENGTFERCAAYELDSRALYAALSDYVDERSEVYRDRGALRLVRTRQLVIVSDPAGREEQVRRVKEVILSIRSDPKPCAYGWVFQTEHYRRTLVTDFSLVCAEGWWPRMTNTLFWVGSIFGNLFFGWMSDRYGRRLTILLMIYLEVPLAIAASFPSSYWTYTALRVAGGLFFPALYQLPFILALELMPPDKRTYTGIVVGMLFASGMCLLAVLAFLLRDWFWLSLATSLPFLSLYSYYWLIPESPRWLVGRGRIAEAERVLLDLARRNGVHLPRGFLLDLHKKVKEEEDAAFVEETTLPIINGHVIGMLKIDKEDTQLVDRRMSTMLSFKPDKDININKTNRQSDAEEINKTPNLERIIALEVAEIVNRKTRQKSNKEDHISIESSDKEVLEVKEEDDEESQLNTEQQQKATQTDAYAKSPVNSLRRKSMQFVSKMFHKESMEASPENKKMDDQNSIGDCQASPLDVFRYPNIRKKFFILTFDWVVLGVVYNTLCYNTPNLGVDDFVAFFIGGAVELPSYFIAWKLMDRFGRRWVLCIFMSVGGVACLSCVLVPESNPWLMVSLVMLGRLCAAASFSVFYVMIGELLPTVLRAQAMGAASFIAGLGLLACPYIVYLAVYSKLLPLVIMGVLCILGGGASLFLPETLNQPLPQTLSDGEMFGRHFKLLSCVGGER
ncbi:unnamed protein product [Plutella xylostella]|uniref:(diamondback moth) hypothetical protein n=1 Tax=Plutella xylostella TaxID=51655 RepID=A0A8S4FSK2_PLUXY|nr:unnamed protein product [Plutella xylostella]